MIIGLFISIFIYIVGGLIGILPVSSGLPSGIHDGLTQFISLADQLNYIFPVAALLQVLGLALGLAAAFLLYDFIMWIKGLFSRHD